MSCIFCCHCGSMAPNTVPGTGNGHQIKRCSRIKPHAYCLCPGIFHGPVMKTATESNNVTSSSTVRSIRKAMRGRRRKSK